jgi:AcrR family transcriptional regulator
MTWERARSEEQIEYRVNEILEATAKLYEAHRFEEITFVMIAKEAGFTRSNLYRYFKTKEDIFLKLLAHDIRIWGQDIQKNFNKEVSSLPDFAKAWANTFLTHKRMLDIYTILYTLLEKNATLEALVDFKKSLIEDIGLSVATLSKALSTDPDTAMEFLYASMSIITGIYPLMELSPKQKEATRIAGMEMSDGMVTTMLEKNTLYLLKGMLN